MVSPFGRARFRLPAALLWALPVFAQAPPEPPSPVPDPEFSNLFYGAVPASGENAPVLVFVPGFLETAQMWWSATGNDMYAYAYQAGLRTAFMSPNELNLPSTAGTGANARMLEKLMPSILRYYQVSKVYLVGHSLGGLDIQAMLASTQYLGTARAVFTLATPNQGDALADWLFTVAGEPLGLALGLLVPGLADCRTSFVQPERAQWDPIFQASGIPFFTLSGDTYLGNPLTEITGPVLQLLTGGSNAPPNDGLVDEPESLLPASYATVMGVINGNHFEVAQGHNSFPYIYQQVSRRETGR